MVDPYALSAEPLPEVLGHGVHARGHVDGHKEPAQHQDRQQSLQRVDSDLRTLRLQQNGIQNLASTNGARYNFPSMLVLLFSWDFANQSESRVLGPI